MFYVNRSITRSFWFITFMMVFSTALLLWLPASCKPRLEAVTPDRGPLGRITTAALANTFEPGENWFFKIPIEAGPDGDAILEWRILGWQEADGVIAQSSESVRLTGQAQEIAVTIPSSKRLGWFRVQLSLRKGKKELGSRWVDVSIVPSPHAASDDFGAYINMMGGYLDPSQIEKNLKLARRIGLGWGRSLFDWDDIEPRQNEFKFQKLDRIIELASANDLRLIVHFPLSAKWNSSAPKGLTVDLSDPLHKAGGWFAYPPKNLSDYRDMVARVTKHTAGKVKYWEVWNEPDLAFYWKGKPDAAEYLDLLKVAYLEIRQADPSARVVVAAPFNPGDPSFIRRLLELGGEKYFDVANCHIYGQMPTSPEDAVAKLLSILAEAREQRAIFVTELGWVTPQNDMRSQRDSAIYLVQACAVLRGAGINKIFWHAIRGFGPEANQPEVTSSLVTYRFSPKMGYVAYATVARELSGFRPSKTSFIAPPGVHGHLFEKPNRRVGVFWTSGRPRDLVINTKLGSATVVDIMGNEQKIQAKAGKVIIFLDQVPVFVRY